MGLAVTKTRARRKTRTIRILARLLVKDTGILRKANGRV
jgi:hypothetical protein